MSPISNLYGTAALGGSAVGESGAGVVFKLDPAGHYTVLYTFTGGADGGSPITGVIRDSAGNLYGTTVYGGKPGCISGCGVVYKVDTTGQEKVLYSFTGGADGANPYSGLTADSAGTSTGLLRGAEKGDLAV